MARDISLLDRVRIASPCNVPWDSMRGDDRTRHCDQCNLNVYNLADMPRGEAEQLVASHEGQLCIRMHVRIDGTFIAQNCPVGMRLARRAAARVVGFASVLLAASAQAASFLLMNRPGSDWLEQQQPMAVIMNWLNPPPQRFCIMGALMMPPPQNPPASASSGTTAGVCNPVTP